MPIKGGGEYGDPAGCVRPDGQRARGERLLPPELFVDSPTELIVDSFQSKTIFEAGLASLPKRVTRELQSLFDDSTPKQDHVDAPTAQST